MRKKFVILKSNKNKEEVSHRALDRPRPGFLGHNFTNDNDTDSLSDTGAEALVRWLKLTA